MIFALENLNLMASKNKKIDFIKNLSWDDLREWAGSKILSRGRDYQKSGQVEKLAVTPAGALVAWVQGTHQYATLVDIKNEDLVSDCDCPYGGTCKHAVAVVLEALEYLKKKKEIPACSDKDQRLEALADIELDEDEDEDWEEDEEELEEDWDREREREEKKSHPNRDSSASKTKTSDSFQSFLEEQTKAQLVGLIQELAKSYPEVRQALEDQLALSKGTVNRMIQSIRNEIDELSSKPGWRHHWNDEGYTPDYSRVEERLKALLSKGYADEVVSLGKELLKAGTRQIEMSDDEGETGMEISSCLGIVFKALQKSTLSPVQQMVWAVDAELMDEYDLCQGLEQFWNHKFTKDAWNNLADILSERLSNFRSRKKEDRLSSNFERDRLSNWAIKALEKAGRQKEIIPLCEQEAEETENYPRLVSWLVKTERLEEAEQWIQKGFKATLNKLPGIAHDLRNTLRDIREKEGNKLQAASFRAEEFFYDPTLNTFRELRKTAEKAKVWPEVKAAAMQYLETGRSPKKFPSWPLPVCEIPLTYNFRKNVFPVLNTLIDIAIADKEPAKVLYWYDRSTPNSISWGWGSSRDEQVAKAVVDEYPDRAIAIWKKLAENLIALTKPRAYEEAASYLRKINQTLKKLGKVKEWQNYLNDLRQKNIRKIRLIEILDSFDGRPIINGSG